ncbi:hypothetical protein HK107_03145 [Parvularcula sp. ZS-1/3]|uniref:Sialate O-acetylesterase domain-containing protein n=1 Tax=Parvularcula mediterranea TaxID=2732508 RepID=A0A7Y3W4K0_9PROT|nr:sialate O-acetylesterase [Parvularcula mediterranea]NNU15321.1 hypothetical protein [Parvularcula mediterranea]
MRKILGAAGVMLALTACGQQPGDTYKVYYLGGQSNMDGFGFNEDLPPELVDGVPEVLIYHGDPDTDGTEVGGEGFWRALTPGHGIGYRSTADEVTLSARFGPELSFAGALKAGAPDSKIAIIKYSRGGTGLMDGVSGYGSWDPDGYQGGGPNQLDYALTTIGDALAVADIDGDGRVDRLEPAGIVWMQGEADAYDSAEASSQYAENLAELMGIIRGALGSSDIPIVLGQIKDSGDTPETRVMAFSPEVQAQQRAFAERDPCASVVTVTEGFSFLPDGWHYQSEDYLTLGRAFADRVLALELECGP